MFGARAASLSASVTVTVADRVAAEAPAVIDITGVAGARRSKVSVAIGWFENLPVPLMLVIVPCGEVAALVSENSAPFSVPALYGNRSTWCCDSHSF